ncbi:hypothetical protein OG967_39900 [Streptomyces phaeochromogenes]
MTTPPKKPAYPGRPDLDTANMRMRRAFAAAARYAQRKRVPASFLTQLEEIVVKATAEIEACAHRAEALYTEEPLRRTAAKAARAGSPRMLALQAKLESHVTGTGGPADGPRD